jgi:hypothetical protein
MPRRARIAPGEIVYRVLNRANGRNELFHKPEDYSAFERIMIGPLDAPADWIDWVNGAQTAGELDALRKSVNRGAPYGSEDWTMRIANMLELEFTLHPRSRREEKSVESHQKRLASPFLFNLNIRT